MKLITRKELLEIKTPVIYQEYDKDEIDDEVYIKYHLEHFTNDWAMEKFPISIPEYKECIDYSGTLEKFYEIREGEVSTCRTTREATYEPSTRLYIVYSKADVKTWIDKLNKIYKEYQIEY